ncbi:MAG: gamma-glutamyltransferase [Phycisphaeraceae bacterium]|nr:gamma-glutamyltransferase [Phycisphaerales bacterium]MCB9842719.1 gamma-glutamyltransferase [Phycisphaeraceae bacterium]
MKHQLVQWLFAAACLVTVPGCNLNDRAGRGFEPIVRALEPVAQENQRRNAQYSHGAVAADHPLASWAGAEMLRQGGNAVDAAVATSFALSVVRPESCGIGGGGFMLIHLTDDPRTRATGDAVTVALDYRERAPAAITPGYFENLPDDASTFTGHAVAIPATVHGLLTALETFGTLDRATVIAPAVRIAREGFKPDAHHKQCIDTMLASLDARHDQSPSAQWLRATYANTERIINEPQARALEIIARDGRSAFQSGEISRAIVAAVREHSGSLTLDDMAHYEPKIVAPLWGSFRGHRIASMPLPSSGGITILQILHMMERWLPAIEAFGSTSPEYSHLLAECMKHAFSDRAEYLGDPEFADIPVAQLLDPAYLDARAQAIDMSRTFPPEHYTEISAEAFPNDAGTSHMSIVDQWGNAVACTETINLEFGSRIAVPEFGFCLNNQMDDFQTRGGRGTVNAFGLVQSDRNLPEAGKRPLSSMSPTIVFDEADHVELVAGASGGPRIISGTVQGILNVLVWDRTAYEAVFEGRIHHQWMPDLLYFDYPPMGPDMLEAVTHFQSNEELLEEYEIRGQLWINSISRLGHTLSQRDDIAHVQLIRRATNANGIRVWQAASDPRKGGAPDGH